MATTTTTTTSPSHNLLTIKAHTGSCHVARYDTKGRYLLTAGSDRTIKLWSASASSSSFSSPASNPIKTYTSGHNYDILSLDITSDNSRFASAGVDKNIVVWDVATSSILRRFNAHTGTVFDVKFAGAPVNTDGGTTAGGNDGSLLVTGGFDATLRMYDLRAQGAWRPILESKEGNDAIQCLQVRGSTVWTGSVDGVVRMYDVRMGSVTQDTIDGQCRERELGTSALLFGAFLVGMSAAQNYPTVAVLRVFIGGGQAFIQGQSLYLSLWYKRDELATRAGKAQRPEPCRLITNILLQHSFTSQPRSQEHSAASSHMVSTKI